MQGESCHDAHGEVLKVMTINSEEYKRSEVLAAGLFIPTERTCKDQCLNPKSPLVPADYTFDFEATGRRGPMSTCP